jgi:predicted Zn-dependent peptidase
VANRHIDAYLFGAYHPYGRMSSMTAYEDLQRESLHGFFRRHYALEHCRIFMAGNVPPGTETLLNQLFGTEKSEGITVHKEDFALQPETEKKYRISNDPDGVQGAVRIARLFPNRYHPDFPGMTMLNTIFGGYFGSRLMSNIREDKGYTYGIFSALYNNRQSGAINIMTEAGKDVCEATITEVYREMERLRETPVPEEELSLVRNYMIGSILGDLDGPFKVLQRWKSLILHDLDEQYFDNSVHTIKTISAADLQQLARQYLNPEEFYELVVV